MEQAGTMTERAHHPIRLVVTDDLQRNRLTSFFRLIVAIPHLVWLARSSAGLMPVLGRLRAPESVSATRSRPSTAAL